MHVIPVDPLIFRVWVPLPFDQVLHFTLSAEPPCNGSSTVCPTWTVENLEVDQVPTPNATPSMLRCYVLVERSARLELDGYDLVVWHVVLEAFASDTR